MTISRFLILFTVYALSILAGTGITQLFPTDNYWKKTSIIIIVGFIVLATPLTILTLLK